MGKYILCTKILLVCSLIENARPESQRCERRLVCGSNEQIYANSCDFEQALRRDPSLEMVPLHECLGMVYVVMPTEPQSALISSLRNNNKNNEDKFVDTVKIFTKKVVESVGPEKMDRAVQVLQDEVTMKVKQMTNQVNQAMRNVLNEMKKFAGKAGKKVVKR